MVPSHYAWAIVNSIFPNRAKGDIFLRRQTGPLRSLAARTWQPRRGREYLFSTDSPLRPLVPRARLRRPGLALTRRPSPTS